LEADAKEAAGSEIVGKATGIAPGFEKTVPGIGTVAISQIATARRQGDQWTLDGQPRWRADGKVLSGLNSDPMPNMIYKASDSDAPTEIRLQYAGSNWHKVNTRIKIDGERTEPYRGVPGGLIADIRWGATRSFDPKQKEATVDLEIADGPWTVLQDLPVDIKPATVGILSNDGLKTGLILTDDDEPRILEIESPTDLRNGRQERGELLPKPPAETAHRFVVVLKDGTEHQIPSATTNMISNRPGEDLDQERFDKLTGRTHYFASDVKEVRYEYRPISRVVRFDHVAIKPIR
jgi:hypothetical protein